MQHHASRPPIRISVKCGHNPRVMVNVDRDTFASVSDLISHICHQLSFPFNTNLLLILGDTVIYNLDSIRENDRLTLVTPEHIMI